MKHPFLPLLALLTTLAGCGPDKDADKPAGPPPPTAVTLVAARTTEAVYYDEYPATAVALNSVELRSQVGGFITGLSFQEGEVVTKGQKLYEIDRRTYEAAYQQALAGLRGTQATVQNAQLNLTRYQRLAQQDAIAGQIVDNAATAYTTAQAQVAQARAAVDLARANRSYSVITAPFSGRIGISQVRLGSQISPGTTLLNTISTENPVGVDFVINETELPRFMALQSAGKANPDSLFRLELPDGSLYRQPGRIKAIARGVEQQTATVQVRVEFANPERRLKDGMSTVLRVLNRQSGQRLIIPYKAVTDQMGESFVFVAGDSSKARQRKVQLGPQLRDQVVVLEGLRAGDQVITEGFQRLRDGSPVQDGPPPTAAGSGPAAPPARR
jgi:membrane fusion protein (multidrug efflux system)